MKSEWNNMTLGEIGEIVGGATPSTKIDNNYNGKIPWITPKDLSLYKEKYIFTGERSITKDGFNSSSVRMIPKGSVLFSSRAPIGYIAIAGTELCTNQGFKSVIPNEKTLSEFLYYLLKYNTKKISSMGSGTTFKEVSGAVMKNIKVRVPPLSIQKAIADTLSCLDAKIELNNKINKNLEAQAQAIFKSWFIDFEPFQDGEFVESELGLIPKGWSVVPIGNLVEKTIAGDWGKENIEGNYSERVYCVRGADIPDVLNGDKGKMPIRYILKKNLILKKLTPSDLVIEISGGSPSQSTGRVVRISRQLLARYDADMVCTNFCRALSIKEGYSSFVFRYWRYFYDLKLMFSYENGTTGIKNFDLTNFLNKVLITIPPVAELEKFNLFCDATNNKIYCSALESETLAALRDLLLPKLMSGEIEIPLETN